MIINLLVAVVCSLVLGIGIVHAAEPDPAVLKHLKQLNAEVKSAYQGGDYEKGIETARKAAEYAEQHFGAEDFYKLAPALNNLAMLYETQGDYARAEPLYQRALAIGEKSLRPEHPAFSPMLNNLAALYYAKGDYSRAEPLYQRSLAIVEKALGPEHPNVATSLNNLAALYQDKGDYKRAETLQERALAMREKILGPEHPEVATSLSHLASIYQHFDENSRAEPLYQRALAINEKALGLWHPAVAKNINNLAVLYDENGDTVRAEPLYQRSLAILEKALGPEHPDVATSLNNLAVFYQEKGDYVRAEPLYERALAIGERAFGGEHPDIVRGLGNLVALSLAQGDSSHAVELKTRSLSIEERRLGPILTTGSEAQKRAYAKTLAGSTAVTLSLHLDAAPENLDAARLALTTLLQRKGRVLDALTEGLATLRSRLTPEDRALLDQLMAVRSQLANRVNQGPGQTEPDHHRAQLAQLETEADRLETEISRRSGQFRAQNQRVTMERVQQALPSGAALVELAVYRPFNPKAAKEAERFGAPRVAAYVLFPQGEPRWVALGEAVPIDQAVEALRVALRYPSSRPPSRGVRGQVLEAGPGTTAVANSARTLDELVMRPIRQLLGDTRTVFFSPDGPLNLVPIGALVDENGHHLIEDYHLTYLTSGRDLLRLQLEHQAQGNALVLADPDFGATGGKLPKGAAPDRGRRSADLTRGKIEFDPLPGTAQEAKAIGPLLGAQPVTRAHATETALKQVHQPSVLHIATHGFFLPDQPEEHKAAINRGLASDRPLPAPRAENPLLRSGLALAGANRLQSGSEDGLLTALEASGLDLWGTQLVVLSACETGVGKVQTGEGVYGLRRALVNAGAETQVMSLWKVDDAATRDLMVDYYRRLKAGEGRSEALRQAQLAMLQSKDRGDPYYWASFIVSGDWRQLRNHGAMATVH